MQESGPESAWSHRKLTFCPRHPLPATQLTRTQGGILPWRGEATPRFFHASPPFLPRRGRGVRGEIGEARGWREEGGKNEGWGPCHRGAQCTAYAYPYPPPASQALAPSLLQLPALRLCTTFMGDIAQMGTATKLGGPAHAPYPPTQRVCTAQTDPTVHAALPSLVCSLCRASRGMACNGVTQDA